MPLEVFGGGEPARALQNQVDTKLVPRQVRRVRLGERHDPSAIDDQRVLRDTDIAVVAAVDSVVFDEIREVLRIGDIVDGDEIEPFGIEEELQGGSSNPAQAVDGYVRHVESTL